MGLDSNEWTIMNSGYIPYASISILLYQSWRLLYIYSNARLYTINYNSHGSESKLHWVHSGVRRRAKEISRHHLALFDIPRSSTFPSTSEGSKASANKNVDDGEQKNADYQI